MPPRALARGDVDDAPVTQADRVMLRYALKLTREPWATTAEDVEELREHGFDDTAIHDLCHVASYCNYVNRMADGLGVELESASLTRASGARGAPGSRERRAPR